MIVFGRNAEPPTATWGMYGSMLSMAIRAIRYIRVRKEEQFSNSIIREKIICMARLLDASQAGMPAYPHPHGSML